MAPSGSAPRSTLVRLYLEEVRALPRGRFALAGAALLLGVLTVLAAGPAVSMSGGVGLWGFGFVAYVLVPSALAAVVAARVAGARASRFVHGVFTMPVTKGQFLAALLLASLTLGALYLAATLPFVAVAGYHLEGQTLLPGFLAVGAAMVALAVVLGTLLGVLFTGRGVAAAAGLAAAVSIASALGVVYLAGLLTDDARPEPGGLALRAAHLSPAVLLMGAARLFPFGSVPASPGTMLAAAGLLAAGLLALAAWVYLREQGVESWESTGPRRALVALALVAVFLAPAAVAGEEYVEGGARLGLEVGTSTRGIGAKLVPSGAAPSLETGGSSFDRSGNLAVGVPHARDLVVVFAFHPVNWTDVTDVHVAVRADPGLLVEGQTDLRLDVLPADETVWTKGFPGPPPQEPQELRVLRIPLTLTPTRPETLAWNVYAVEVDVTFTVAAKPDAPPGLAARDGPQSASATLPVLADVPGASAHMALAGAPLALACVAGAAARRLRTR